MVFAYFLPKQKVGKPLVAGAAEKFYTQGLLGLGVIDWFAGNHRG